MSKNKDRTNGDSNIYPSDYIDFTPQSTKSNIFTKIIIVVIIVVFLTVLFYFFSHQIESSVPIGRIEKIVQEIINEQKQLENQVRTRDYNKEQLEQIIKLDIRLQDTRNNLQEIKRKFAQGKYSQIDDEKLKQIIRLDIQLQDTRNNLQRNKRRLYPDFSQDLRKEGSKTARIYVAKEFQQFEV